MSSYAEQVIQELKLPLRSPKEWAEGKGLFLVVAHFLSGVGAGGWLIGLLLASPLLLLWSWLLVLLSGLTHLLFLGRPSNAWQMIKKPQSSWISRGLWSIVIFLVAGFFYFLPYYFPAIGWDASSGFGIFLLLVSILGMIGVFLYKGFVYAANHAVSYWHSPILPLIYILFSLRGGLGLLFLIAPQNMASIFNLSPLTWWLGISFLIIILFLFEWGLAAHDLAAKKSIENLLKGALSWPFYLGVVTVGFIIPIILTLVILTNPPSLTLIGLLSLIGDLVYKYCSNRTAYYKPILIGSLPNNLKF